MKKNMLLFCTVLTSFSLMAFGYLNWGNTETDQEKISTGKIVDFDRYLLNITNKQADFDLFYNVDSRFMTTITKENLHKAKSIIDILPAKATRSIESYQSVQLDIIDKTSEMGNSDVLNVAQLKLLHSTDYSTDIYIRADYKIKNTATGELEDNYLTYFITIIPEKEAEFTNGRNALITYLKENSKEKTAIIEKDQLKPGKVSFTITKNGTISNVKLSSTSGYPSVDEALVELVCNIPGKWDSATNSIGEKVDQELVFFFGLQGC